MSRPLSSFCLLPPSVFLQIDESPRRQYPSEDESDYSEEEREKPRRKQQQQKKKKKPVKVRKPVRRVEMMESSDDEDLPPRRMAHSHDGRLGQYSAAVPSNSALRESLLVQVRSERRRVCVGQ